MTQNNIYVEYVKISNLNANGEEIETDYAVHIFHSHSEVLIHHSSSFEELKESIRGSNLLELVSKSDMDAAPNESEELVHENKGLYFNQKWINLEELQEITL
ncbi:hypothetical protein [Oceanobacillus luteolus]|uniref:Uncharacterized protein n=1 Tax=Oceanobacillus luteolus TaxID=1274358 RepID=A0ABW4HW37_9BACI